jgi:hypothetical protein
MEPEGTLLLLCLFKARHSTGHLNHPVINFTPYFCKINFNTSCAIYGLVSQVALSFKGVSPNSRTHFLSVLYVLHYVTCWHGRI